MRAPRAPMAGTPAPLGILVVDDNTDAVATLADLLQAQGHAVAVAEDARTALERVHGGTRVFILDIGLPDMTGYELAEHLRERIGERPATFVALTGYGRAFDRERSKAAGFDHHLVKPVDMTHLAQLIAEAAEQAPEPRPARA